MLGVWEQRFACLSAVGRPPAGCEGKHLERCTVGHNSMAVTTAGMIQTLILPLAGAIQHAWARAGIEFSASALGDQSSRGGGRNMGTSKAVLKTIIDSLGRGVFFDFFWL